MGKSRIVAETGAGQHGVATAAAARKTGRRLLLLIGTLLSMLGLAGAAFAPLAAPWVWAILTGLGLGVQFTAALTLPVDYGADPDEVGRLTAMVMIVGYLLASIGPVAIGWLRDVTGSFEVPFATLVALVLVLTIPVLRLPATASAARD